MATLLVTLVFGGFTAQMFASGLLLEAAILFVFLLVMIGVTINAISDLNEEIAGTNE